MPHNPIKSVKIDFHTADGVTPKPQPLPQAASSDPAGMERGGMEKQPAPQTSLSPLHEVLFKNWAMANGVDENDHSSPDNHYDYRGMYLQTGGKVHQPGAIAGAASQYNNIMQKPQLTLPGQPNADQLMQQKRDTVSSMGGNPMMTPGLGHLPPTPQGFGQPPEPSPVGGQPIQQLIELLRQGQQ